ncbi:hypothetical protein ACLHZX_17905, partial [Aeromonas media]
MNYALGLLRATQAGAVADGGPVTVSASYNAVTGTRIAGNVQPEVKAKLTLDGRSVIGGGTLVLAAPPPPLAFLPRAARVYPDYPALIHGPLRQSWAQTE